MKTCGRGHKFEGRQCLKCAMIRTRAWRVKNRARYKKYCAKRLASFRSTHPYKPTVYSPVIGDVFGNLTVIRIIRKTAGLSVVCKCKCGKEREFKACEIYGVTKKFASCNINGCRRDPIVKHGCKRGGKNGSTTEYVCWVSMIQRCTNPSVKNYHRYGGRGIKVCARWLNSFQAFLEDMGEKPTSKHSIERKNNNGNYEPGNCKWATQKEQSNNQCTNRFITANGKTLTVSQWSDKLGVTQDFLNNRVHRKWSDERIINEPKHNRRSR